MKEMNKEAFIRQIYERSDFTLDDVKTMWRIVEEIFADAIRGRIILNLRGFGKMYVAKVKKRKAYVVETKKYENFPETERVFLKLSDNFKNLLK